MTDVFLSHNPFTIKTELIINAEPVGSTSKLYRYLSTPMQDWVDSFLPTLVEHCNDDEIALTFKGLQYNYDDLSTALQAFLKANREYDIKLAYDASRSQLARLGAIRSLVDELQTQTVVEELKQADFCAVMGTEAEELFEVHLLGGNDGLKAAFLKDLLGVDTGKTSLEKGCRYIDCDSQAEFVQTESGELFDTYSGNIPFASAKFMRLAINDLPNTETQSNAYYRFTKKAIKDEKKPAVIYLLDQDSNNNNPEYLNQIAQQFLLRGKQNKNRFIFVAENPLWAKKMLNSEYAMKNATVYATDDIEKINHSIAEYMNENCLVEKIAAQAKAMTSKLNILSEQMSAGADLDKKSEKVDDIEQRALGFLEKIKYAISCNYPVTERKDDVCAMVQSLTDIFQEECLPIKLLTKTDKVKASVISFIKEKLPALIQLKVNDMQSKVQERCKQGLCFDDNLFSALQELGCVETTNKLKELAKLSNCSVQFPFTLDNLNDIKLSYKVDAPIARMNRVLRGSSATMATFTIFSSNGCSPPKNEENSVKSLETISVLPNGDELHEFAFFDGLLYFIPREIYGASYVENKTLLTCKETFYDNMEKITPAVLGYIDKFIAQFIQDTKNKIEAKRVLREYGKEEIQINAEKLRTQAQISAQDQARLDYITALADKVQALIAL